MEKKRIGRVGTPAVQVRKSHKHEEYLALLDEPRKIWFDGREFDGDIPPSIWNDFDSAIDLFEDGDNDLEVIDGEPYETMELSVDGHLIRIIRKVDMVSLRKFRDDWSYSQRVASEFYEEELYKRYISWCGRDDEKWEEIQEEPMEFAIWMIDELLKELNKKYR